MKTGYFQFQWNLNSLCHFQLVFDSLRKKTQSFQR